MTTGDRRQQHGTGRKAPANHPNPGTSYTARGSISPIGGSFRARFIPVPSGAARANSWVTMQSLVARPFIPEDRDDFPILAHRAAKLRLPAGGTRIFGSLNMPYWFGVDADARCGRIAACVFGNHGVPMYDLDDATCSDDMPGTECECGFYALPPDQKPLYLNPDLVTLLVELSGKVIICERGYRAKHQRVVECQLPACRYPTEVGVTTACGQPAVAVDFYGPVLAGAYCAVHDCPERRATYCTRCDQPFWMGRPCPHQPMFYRVTLEALRAILPVPVTAKQEDESPL